MKQAPTFRYGANSQVVGKCDPQKLSYPGAWSHAEGSLTDLAEHIGKGHPWMPALLDGNSKRWQNNANHAEVLALDIDEGMSISEAQSHPFISQYCSLGIESASSTTEHNKFRLAFRLAHAITSWQTIRICNRYLAHLVDSADPACKDASRFFFGAPGRLPFLLNESASLPATFIDNALAWHEAIEQEEQRKAEAARQQWERWRSQHSEQDSDALLLDALDCIDPDCGYNDWIAIGMALAGMGDQWFTAWDSWSVGSSSYDAREMASKWKSFRGKRPAPEVVFGIAKKYGFEFPKRENREFGDRDIIPKYAKLQSELDREQTIIEQAQAIERLKGNIKRDIQRVQSKPKGFGKPDVIPNAHQGNEGVWEVSSQEEGYALAQKHGARVVINASGTGDGKSHHIAHSHPKDWGVEKIVSVLPDFLNPAVEEFNNWDLLEGRHLGNVEVDGKKRRATIETRDSVKVDPANCHAAFAQGLLGDRNTKHSDYDLACYRCKFRFMCGKEEGNGYGARYQAHQTLKQPRIRTSYARITDEVASGAMVHFDEHFSNAETYKKIDVSPDDIAKTWQRLSFDDPEMAERLRPLFQYLSNRQYENETKWDKKYGATLADIPKLQHLLPQGFDITHVAEFENGDDELELFKSKSGNPLSDDELKRLKKLSKKQGLSRDELAEMGMLEYKAQSNKGKLSQSDRTQLRELQKNHITPTEVKELLEMEKRHEDSKFTSLTAGEMAEKARQLPKKWLFEFCSILLAGAGNIRIQSDGAIAISIATDKYQRIIQNAAQVVITDASAPRNKAVLSPWLGVPEHQIFVFRVKQPVQNNITRFQVLGLGSMARQRGEKLEKAKGYLVEGLARQGNHAHLDWKEFSHDGVLFLDSIGSNAYQDCDSISITPPRPNIGAVLDEYICLTGHLVNKDDEEFQRYYNQKVAEQIYQAEGRLRANRRSDQHLRFYVITDKEMPYQFDETIYSWEIDPRAARKGDRTLIQIAHAVEKVLKTGQQVTPSAVHRAIEGVKCSRQYVSRVWDRVQLILYRFHKKGCTLPAHHREALNSEVEREKFASALAGIIETIAPVSTAEEIAGFLLDDIETFIWRDVWELLSISAQQHSMEALVSKLPIASLRYLYTGESSREHIP